MTEFNRELIENDPVFSKLFKIIKANHKIADHTKKILFKNRNVKNFCEEARHFSKLDGSKPIYIHYDVASWYKHPKVLVSIESIGVYDNFIEYEVARLKGVHSTTNSDGGNLN